jgi:hypothetical protein
MAVPKVPAAPVTEGQSVIEMVLLSKNKLYILYYYEMIILYLLPQPRASIAEGSGIKEGNPAQKQDQRNFELVSGAFPWTKSAL